MDTKGFFSNWIVKNLLLAAALILVLVLGASVLLNIGTRHGKEITVPDFTNRSVDEALRTAASVGVRVEVTDSVYVRKMGRGLVFSQVPKAGGKVKEGRRIMLTINSKTPKKVSTPDIATNYVLKQQYRGRDIGKGVMVNSGSVIDLVVGLSDDDETMIPDVTGMRYLRAVDAVLDNSLNISGLKFDKNVKNYSDSLDAVVYRQAPEPSEFSVTRGSGVTLYLRLEDKGE